MGRGSFGEALLVKHRTTGQLSVLKRVRLEVGDDGRLGPGPYLGGLGCGTGLETLVCWSHVLRRLAELICDAGPLWSALVR